MGKIVNCKNPDVQQQPYYLLVYMFRSSHKTGLLK